MKTPEEVIGEAIEDEWLDIESAPTDGSQIIGAWRGHEDKWLHGVFCWRECQQYPGLYGWFFICTERFNKPTHWIPIPDHKAAQTKEAATPKDDGSL